jgi:excisionase family DNA binding protein
METDSPLSTLLALRSKDALPLLLTVREVATVLRISRKTVDKLVFSGAIVAAKVGGQWRVRPEEILAYLSRTEQRPVTAEEVVP